MFNSSIPNWRDLSGVGNQFLRLFDQKWINKPPFQSLHAPIHSQVVGSHRTLLWDEVSSIVCWFIYFCLKIIIFLLQAELHRVRSSKDADDLSNGFVNLFNFMLQLLMISKPESSKSSPNKVQISNRHHSGLLCSFHQDTNALSWC